ncbi:carbohydrate ABC transporter permease [Microvirga lotononidis]|uniref:Permease component of ABC-type sugar transporter n=1 Tax=Microvirga lotononidis TaxID=864069 RepID=I4YXH9_9HYPH|nr:sugar ABC transporter permease [Microvirga lotononidis]EIM28671.1 permease component of ABC-type sugar transporter [Microvirga lotononidis]WQO25588.1 sugar ABC transporter permease [Microvirga lotononidis]
MSDRTSLPFLLLAPSALFLVAFFLWPMLDAAILAFQDGQGHWSLTNFVRMAQDLHFIPALGNTFLIVGIVVPLQVMLALAMALLLTKLTRGRDTFLYIFAMPLGISDLAAGIVWLAIFTERGFLNSFLFELGVIQGPQLLLSHENLGMLFTAVVVSEVWRATAIVLVILFAGLQMIPREYYEASEVFGAGPLTRFFKVTLPLLRPSLQTALILRTVMAFEMFSLVMALAGRNLPMLVGEAYLWQGAYQNSGVAAAYAVLILAISVIAVLLYLRLLRVHEEMLP